MLEAILAISSVPSDCFIIPAALHIAKINAAIEAIGTRNIKFSVVNMFNYPFLTFAEKAD